MLDNNVIKKKKILWKKAVPFPSWMKTRIMKIS